MSVPFFFESALHLGATAYLIRLRPEVGFVFRAGQYLKLVTLDVSGTRPVTGYFSIASAPESSSLELVVRTNGGTTAADALIKLTPGAQVAVEGPYGDSTFKAMANRKICLVSQGTGVAPMLSILRSRAFAEANVSSAILLAGFRDELEMIGLEPFGGIPHSVQYLVALSQPRHSASQAFKGRVTDQLRHGSIAIDWPNTDFYVCGRPDMVEEVRTILFAKGVSPGSIIRL